MDRRFAIVRERDHCHIKQWIGEEETPRIKAADHRGAVLAEEVELFEIDGGISRQFLVGDDVVLVISMN